jgi:peptide/nickel transport system ATP-binding protein
VSAKPGAGTDRQGARRDAGAPGAPLAIRDLAIALPVRGDRAYAVEGIDVDVGPGEIVCLVGESGSGKSAIAQAVMGLLPPALPVVSGRISVSGEDIVGASETQLAALRGTRMAMVFQEPATALNPLMRCGAQIEEALKAHAPDGAAVRHRRALAALREVGIDDATRIHAAWPHEISGGQRQRVMIAMALVLAPALLIADEPTTALDVTTQAQILALIRRLAGERGTGVLFITHDFGVVAEVADRVVALQRGRIVESGARDEVLGHPRDPYTKMLLASVPNLVPPLRAPVEGAPVLEARGLGKTWPVRGVWAKRAPFVAFADVDLALRRGEVLGLVGESGSGKSTVARSIARLIEPTSGVIELDGTDIARLGVAALRPLRRKLQIVFQDPYRSLDPRRPVGESIIEGPLNYGVTRDAALARARELLDLVQLPAHALLRFPHEFSGGQRQRICIARALALEPEVLIADEPVSALDVSVQARVLALLADIRDRYELAILFITHDLRVAAQVCDRIAVMQRGRIVETGATREVFAHPRHPWTQALFAAIPGRDVLGRGGGD